MGKTHAVSAVATWLGAGAGAVAFGYQPGWQTVAVGALVAGGAAMLPDVDHPESTIAHTLGPVTRLFSRGFSRLAAATRNGSCDHCARRRSRGGHRALSHTAVFAAGLGGALSLAGLFAGGWVGLVVVWIASGLAFRATLSKRRRGEFGAAILASVVTLTVASAPPPNWWWVGIPVAWGCLAHDAGDALTLSGCPVAWPLRINGCRWHPLGSPRWLRFRTGSLAESAVFAMLAVGGLLGSGYILAAG